MGQTARLLYYDLGMHADDSGVVEAFTVMRMTGASEDDLKLLAAKGFIVILNTDLVTYIWDWKANNMIRSDRRQPSIYEELLAQYKNGEMIVSRLFERVTTFQVKGEDRRFAALKERTARTD